MEMEESRMPLAAGDVEAAVLSPRESEGDACMEVQEEVKRPVRRERMIGEMFEWEGLRLMVVPDKQDRDTMRCGRCALFAPCSGSACLSDSVRDEVGPCNRWKRKDGCDVQFMKV